MTTNLEQQYAQIRHVARQHTIGELATVLLFLRMLQRKRYSLDINRTVAMILEELITRAK